MSRFGLCIVVSNPADYCSIWSLAVGFPVFYLDSFY